MRRGAGSTAKGAIFPLVISWWAVASGVPPARAQSLGSYVEPPVCAGCHAGVWATYRRTGMGRSLYAPRLDHVIEDYKTTNTYYHRPSDTYFTMIQRDGRYYQRQHQIGFDGRETNVVEQQIDYVVGSGNHSRTYLHRTSRNTLIELPLAWYAEKGGSWAMNPGYDRPDHQGFRRLIGYECMFCHNAYPEIPSGSGPDPVYARIPEGIDCQRCHGPGAEHVRIAHSAGAKREDVRRSIVNPARLPSDRQMEVCLECHLETTSFPLPNSIVRYEREPFSYRPGEALGDFMLHFDHAPGTGRDDKFEIAGSAYRLMRSACFQKSNGALRCTTCHNPHDAPRGEEAARHYTAVCRQCHGPDLDRLVAAARHPRSPDCIGCHMPKRRTDDVVHVVMTDHYIQRQKPERDLLADAPERPADESAYRGEVVLYYPRSLSKPEDELYVAAAQVIQNSNLNAGIPRLAAAIEKYRPARADFYWQLADALRGIGKCEQAVPFYEQAIQKSPGSLGTMQKLALCLLSLKQPARAVEILNRALQSAPQDAATRNLLGTAYLEQGKVPDAVQAFQKALELDPEMPESYNSLAGVWLATGQSARAEPLLRSAIRLQPNYAEAQDNLANLLSAAGRFEEARYHFEAALRSKATYAPVRYDYGIALSHVNRLEEAQRQIEASLRIDPNSAEAHEFLGTLLVALGQLQPALEQYRDALRIRPEFGKAQLHLGEALADSGDSAGALPYLQKAAQSSDRAMREEAAKVLEKLNKSR